MADRIDDGGSAFPSFGRSVTRDELGNRWPEEREGDSLGMTLRDYFAAKAMQGLMANPGGPIQASGMSGWDFTNCTDNDVASLSYTMADAMLKARQA